MIRWVKGLRPEAVKKRSMSIFRTRYSGAKHLHWMA